jgi:phytoene dehydrogenase-like protein
VPTEWIRIDPVDRFHFPDEPTFEVPARLDDYLASLRRRFPHEREGIDAFFAEAREAYYHGLIYYFRQRRTARAEALAKYTVWDRISHHINDPRLRAYLVADHSHWGSLPRETSFLFDSMLRLAYFDGNYYPRGSSQTFVDDLAEGFQERGGHILHYTEAKEILVEDGRATGVVVRERRPKAPPARAVRADVVISNADLRHTYEQLLDPSVIGAETLGRVRSMRPSRACFMLHLGVRGLDRELLEEAEGYHWFSWDPEDLDRTFFKLFSTSLLDPGVAPEGCDVVILQKWSDVEFETVDDWEARSRRLEGALWEHLCRMLPGIEKGVEVRLAATARTSFRYTRNASGAMLGWAMTPEQLGEGRPDNVTPVDNLYLVGHWTRPGGGITPVIVSAKRVAEMILSGNAGSHE